MNTNTRRTFLVSSVMFISPGCVLKDPGIGPSNDEVCRYEANVETFNPEIDLVPDHNQFQQTLVHRTIRQGQATAFYGPRPLKRDSYFKFDDAYYRIEHIDSHTVELPALVMSVEWQTSRTPPSDRTVSLYSELPEEDRLALRSAVYGGIYRKSVHPETRLIHAKSPIPYPEGTNDSVFATWGRQWVSWEGRTYQVTVHRTASMEKSAHVYKSTQVAADATSFRELIADRYIIRLHDLTPGEKEILDAAVAGGYHNETKSPSEGWNRLLTRLRDTDLPEAHYEWYIEYDGSWYQLILHSVEACGDRESRISEEN